MACGTGACATATAAIKNNIADRSKPVEIEMDGGTLSIEWKDDNHIYMTGPAAFAFEVRSNFLKDKNKKGCLYKKGARLRL